MRGVFSFRSRSADRFGQLRTLNFRQPGIETMLVCVPARAPPTIQIEIAIRGLNPMGCVFTCQIVGSARLGYRRLTLNALQHQGALAPGSSV